MLGLGMNEEAFRDGHDPNLGHSPGRHRHGHRCHLDGHASQAPARRTEGLPRRTDRDSQTPGAAYRTKPRRATPVLPGANRDSEATVAAHRAEPRGTERALAP